jgi:hypothetical protein
MGFLLNEYDKSNNWRNYFDYIICDGKKPLFFSEGTTLKEINIVCT